MKLPTVISAALLLCTGAVFTVCTTGCATHIQADSTTNLKPAEAFSAFDRFELLPIKMNPPYAGQEANDRALVKIQENFDLRTRSMVEGWNAKPVSSEKPRTLVIAPYIQELKFIGGGARFWAGAMAGSSAVILKMRIYDKDSGTTVAEPQFYQRAAAMGGAWSVGGTDNNMLVRIAEISSQYLQTNYNAAVGGPTGAPPKS